MKVLLRLFPLLVFCVSGCASHEYADGSAMDISVDVGAMHRCSRISPEIEVVNAPAGTALFDVTLEDMTDPSRMHGGGTWSADGDEVIIPEGALTRFYTGPCPPVGTERPYQYIVKALDAQQHTLAVRKYAFEQE